MRRRARPRSVRNASRLDAEEVRASVTMQVQRAYLTALLADRFVDIRTENLALATARMEQVARLEQAGRAARYDLLRARVERSNLEPLLIAARNDRELALLEIKRLLNVPGRPARRAHHRHRHRHGAAARRVRARARGHCRSRCRARRGGGRARATRGSPHRPRRPAPDARLHLPDAASRRFPRSAWDFPTRRGALAPSFCPEPDATRSCQNGGWFQDRAAGLQLSIPVFDGLRAKGNIDLAQAQQRLAELRLRQSREQVTLEVARARAELDRARSDFAARSQTSAEADEAFRLATLRFSRGISTQLEVSDAQLALLTARTGEARATIDLYLAAAELARALGRPVPIP